MPVINIELDANNKFSFNSSEYFVYNTRFMGTLLRRCSFGLGFQEVNYVDKEAGNDYVFGHLFMRKYDLTLNYLLQPKDGGGNDIITVVNLQTDAGFVEEPHILGVLAIMVTIFFFTYISLQLFRQQQMRRDKEDSIFNKIYEKINEVDPGFLEADDNQKKKTFELIKHQMANNMTKAEYKEMLQNAMGELEKEKAVPSTYRRNLTNSVHTSNTAFLRSSSQPYPTNKIISFRGMKTLKE
jgi:hypothetical protein